jgi:MFS family permease
MTRAVRYADTRRQLYVICASITRGFLDGMGVAIQRPQGFSPMLEATAIAERLNVCEPERMVSQRSLRALDWLNFFKADVQTTLGPYLAIFLLAIRHLDLATIGIVMSVPGVVTILTQTPAGALVDWITHKRTLVMLAALGLGASCLLLVAITSLAAMVLAQGMIAIATIVMPPAIAAISVGLVGHRASAQRMGRNEVYSHAGAIGAAVVAGLIAYWIAAIGLFYFAAAMSVAAAIAATTISEEEIEPALAREAEVGSGGRIHILSIRELVHDSRIAIFALAVVLFHLANAAMLPLVGEMLSAGQPALALSYMSVCIIIAQLVMTPIALVAGRLADSWGRKPVFLIGFAALPIRGLLFAITRNPYLLVSVQILDGVGAGIFGVVAVIVVADLARHTGWFNLMQGAMNTCVAIGASLSNLIAGFVAEHKGYGAGFILLSALALLALAFFCVAMPETADEHYKRAN